MNVIRIAIAIILFSCGASADVPMLRGNAAHTGVIPESPLPKPARTPKWRFRTDNKVRSTAAVVTGTVYFGSDDGFLSALEASSGHLKWKFKTGVEVSSSPAVSQGSVFFLSNDRYFYAIDAETGRRRWTFSLGPELPFTGQWDWCSSSPVIVGNTIYFGGRDGYIYALDLSGRKKWSFRTNATVRATPAAADGMIFAGSMDGTLYALDQATGILRWKFKTEGNQYFPVGEIQSSAAVAEGGVYFGSRDGNF